MSETYRAAYYVAPGSNSAGTVLTRPEHADWLDDALRAEALAEAHRAGIIGDDLPEAQRLERLRIGDWTDI